MRSGYGVNGYLEKKMDAAPSGPVRRAIDLRVGERQDQAGVLKCEHVSHAELPAEKADKMSARSAPY